MKDLDKLVNIKLCEEQFQAKEYLKTMKIENARTKFKLRTHMLNVKFNYKHMAQNEKSLWQCDSCQTAIDTQSHIMWCPSYSELKEGKNINNDNDLIEYIKSVMKIRDKLNITK